MTAPGQSDSGLESRMLPRRISRTAAHCAICGAKRKLRFLGAEFYDVGILYGVRPNIMGVNVRYCKDNPECVEWAKNWSVGR